MGRIGDREVAGTQQVEPGLFGLRDGRQPGMGYRGARSPRRAVPLRPSRSRCGADRKVADRGSLRHARGSFGGSGVPTRPGCRRRSATIRRPPSMTTGAGRAAADVRAGYGPDRPGFPGTGGRVGTAIPATAGHRGRFPRRRACGRGAGRWTSGPGRRRRHRARRSTSAVRSGCRRSGHWHRPWWTGRRSGASTWSRLLPSWPRHARVAGALTRRPGVCGTAMLDHQ